MTNLFTLCEQGKWVHVASAGKRWHGTCSFGIHITEVKIPTASEADVCGFRSTIFPQKGERRDDANETTYDQSAGGLRSAGPPRAAVPTWS